MKRYNLLNLLLAAACAVFIGACNDDLDYGDDGVIVGTPVIVEFSGTSAVLQATVNLQDGVRYTNAGFCYDTESTPTIYDSTVGSTIEDGVITDTLTNLSLATIHYVRAYVSVYNGGVVYSNEISLGAEDEPTADEEEE